MFLTYYSRTKNVLSSTGSKVERPIVAQLWLDVGKNLQLPRANVGIPSSITKGARK